VVIDHPAIVKRIDPATAIHALRLPGVIDVLSDLQNKCPAKRIPIRTFRATGSPLDLGWLERPALQSFGQRTVHSGIGRLLHR
jgi:hypothetical protein